MMIMLDIVKYTVVRQRNQMDAVSFHYCYLTYMGNR